MARKMIIGVVSGDSTAPVDQVKDDTTEKVNNVLNDRFHALSIGLLFSSCLPTAEMLAKLKQKKKVVSGTML
jgi:hypothetical protein